MNGTTLPQIGKIKCYFANPLLKNSCYMIFTYFLISGFGFLFWVIISRYYTPDEVGLAAAIFSAAQFIVILSELGLCYGLMRYLVDSNDKHALINSCISMAGSASIVLTIIFIAGLDFFSPKLLFIRNNMTYLAFFSIYTIIYSMVLIQGYVSIASRSSRLYLIQNFLFLFLRTPIPIILASFGLSGILFSWTTAAIISFLFSIFFLIPSVQPGYKFKIEIKRKVISEIIYFSLSNYISGIFWSVPFMAMPLMIVNILGADKAAYFFMAYSIGSLLSYISVSVATSLLTEASYEAENFSNNIIKSLKVIFMLLIPLIMCIFLFGSYILLLFGKTYSDSSTHLLWLIGLSSIPSAIVQVYLTVKRVQKDIKSILYINVFIATIIVALSYFLMVRIGLIGIGYAWVIGYGLAAIVIGLSYIATRKGYLAA